MKVVCVSDNHGRQFAIEAILKKLADAKLFIHCGDSQLPPSAMKDFMIVRGNTDYYSDYPLQLCLDICGHKAIVVHGHRFFSGLPDLGVLARHAKSLGADLVFFGHSHRYCDEVVEGVRLLNPGSLAYNKDGSEACFMLLDVTQDKIKATRVSRASLMEY